MHKPLPTLQKTIAHLPAWIKVLAVFLFAGGIFIAWFVYQVLTQEPPNFFPLNDQHAEYKITKNCPHGQGWVEQPQTAGSAYCLEYRGTQVLLKEDHANSQFFSITIGKSSVKLDAFAGKKVKQVQGKYTSSSQQCIQGVCTDIGGPFVVVNIDALELENSN